jgi:hypothetical protein
MGAGVTRPMSGQPCDIRERKTRALLAQESKNDTQGPRISVCIHATPQPAGALAARRPEAKPRATWAFPLPHPAIRFEHRRSDQ